MRFGHFVSTPFRAVSQILKRKINNAQDVTVGSAIAGTIAASAALLSGAQVANRMESISLYEMLHSATPAVAFADQTCQVQPIIASSPPSGPLHRTPNVPTLLASVHEMGAVKRLDVAQFGRAKKRSDDTQLEQIIESIAGTAPDLGIGQSQSSGHPAIVREFVPADQLHSITHT